MKKLLIIVGIFLIYTFGVVAIGGAVSLGNWIAQGNVWLLYGYYGALCLIAVVFVLYPSIRYFQTPSIKQIARLRQNGKVPRGMIKYLLKTATPEEGAVYDTIVKGDVTAYWTWIETCMSHDLKSFDSIIAKYAKKTTISVMISPNSFIDGLIILISNINMIGELSRTLRLRANIKESLTVLFSILSFSSVAGLFEEFDEVIEEAMEEILEEFAEVFSQDAPTEIVGNIPGLSILPKLISPLLQGAANFSFVYYIGLSYKHTLSAYVSLGQDIDREDIKKRARKEARQMKRTFLKSALKDLSQSSARQTSKAFAGFITSVKSWGKMGSE
jgi:hypothetical protein